MSKYIKAGFIYTLFAVLLLSSNSVKAEEIADVIKKGKAYGDLRLRYEFVDEDNKAKDAHAKTLRTRIGFKTGKYRDFVGLIEAENVARLSNTYNDTISSRSDRPVVADVENTQLNQAWLEYTGIPDTGIKKGRQVITVDNHRYIGHVGWRQNNQVFDAITLWNKSLPDTTAKYGFIHNVNRIFGEGSRVGDWGSKSHYFNISNTSTPLGKLIAYGYILDFGSDAAANSNQSFGGSISGKKAINDDGLDFKYHGEFAYQEDNAENTTNYEAYYYHIAPALMWKGLTATVGWEVLGSDDGRFAFRTPLATLHKFNGWADRFLTTPAAGLEDLYVEMAYKVKDLEDEWAWLNGLLVKFQYHNFQSEEGSMDYGDEVGLFIKKPINKNVWTSVKLANYMADEFSTDTTKVTFDIGFKF